jgi:ABC-type sugar transport system permease subunit
MTTAAPARRGQLSPRAKRKAIAGWVFVAPAVLIYAFFFIQPFFYSIYYSLTDWNGADPVKQFVGLGNYIKLAGDSLLWQALGHNLIWVIIGTVAPIAIGLLLGVLIWTGALGRVVFRTIYFFR